MLSLEDVTYKDKIPYRLHLIKAKIDIIQSKASKQFNQTNKINKNFFFLVYIESL